MDETHHEESNRSMDMLVYVGIFFLMLAGCVGLAILLFSKTNPF